MKPIYTFSLLFSLSTLSIFSMKFEISRRPWASKDDTEIDRHLKSFLRGIANNPALHKENYDLIFLEQDGFLVDRARLKGHRIPANILRMYIKLQEKKKQGKITRACRLIRKDSELTSFIVESVRAYNNRNELKNTEMIRLYIQTSPYFQRNKSKKLTSRDPDTPSHYKKRRPN